MAEPAALKNGPVGPDTLITVKVVLDGQNRRFKIPLRDLGAHVLPQKLRTVLAIPPEVDVKFDRFSDSAGAYVTLDSEQPAIYKQLYRAAKAKLKLRLRATVIKSNKATVEGADEEPAPAMAKEGLAPASATAPATATAAAPATATAVATAVASAVATTTTTTAAAAAAAAAVAASSSSFPPLPPVSGAAAAPSAEPRSTYLETVLQPPPNKTTAPSFKAFTETSRPPHPVCSIPGAFSSSDSFLDPPGPAPRAAHLNHPALPSLHHFPGDTFSIDCNHCGQSVANEHFHCSICDKGDFDLCPACVDSGITCNGDDHWLIKRTVQNGFIMASVTDTCRRKTQKAELTEQPTFFNDDEGERTCNSCIRQLPATDFVTCNDCPDVDLCMACLRSNKHGHHPGHAFEPVDKREGAVSPKIEVLCKAGRSAAHFATCDGCVKRITGVRHKCLSCPDWDFCSDCFKSASTTHPGHRFAPLYSSIGLVTERQETHTGIFCDGPLCASAKGYIKGDRYKCSICHDTDFCAKCEVHPLNSHSKSHPMIKMKIAFRQLSIQTIQDNGHGQTANILGDRPLAKNASTETVNNVITNASTQVQTVAECKPGEETVAAKVVAEEKAKRPADLQAWYESDSTPDGSDFGPNRMVSQSWTLRNPGPAAWPAGCAVYYIGGDDMRNLDARHPSSVSTMTTANRSNVLEHSLEAGKTAVFTVLLRSPSREGRAISYWRLKTPDGTPFGHKLWVDINVQSQANELCIRSAVPPAPTVVDVPESDKADKTIESSQMVFPKLDKESPVSSIHQIDQVSAEAKKEESAKDGQDDQDDQDDQDLWEGVESLDLGEDSEDDLLNDEEYDILDASDEDLMTDALETPHKK